MIAFIITTVIAGMISGVGADTTKITVYFNPPTAPVKVEQLVVGRLEHIQQGSIMRASVTLIEDHGYYMLVDTPSATDLVAKEKMLRGLTASKVYPGQVQLVVTTHGHPDHVGQGNFFPNSRHFFASYEYTGDNYLKTELFTTDVMNVTKNIELWNTPGHTNTDISAIVRNVPCCGTIGVVGDLFYSEADAAGNNTEWIADAWNAEIGQVSRTKVICNVDHIVPGHGKIFRVTDAMRQAYGCNNTITTVTPTPTPTTSTTTTSTTVTIPTTTLPTPSPVVPSMDLYSNIVNDQPIQSIGVTTTAPVLTTLPSSFVTVDHWQNGNDNSVVDSDLSNPVPTIMPQQTGIPEQSTYQDAESPVDAAFLSAMTSQPILQPQQQQQQPSPNYNGGIYAVPAAGPGPAAPVAVPPLSDHLAYIIPGYQVRHPAPQGMILPMFESAAANFVNYLNQPVNGVPCMHVRSVKNVPCVEEPMDYLDIIKMAIKRFANLGITKTVKRNLLESK